MRRTACPPAPTSRRRLHAICRYSQFLEPSFLRQKSRRVLQTRERTIAQKFFEHTACRRVFRSVVQGLFGVRVRLKAV
jgi:hypothetical protein